MKYLLTLLLFVCTIAIYAQNRRVDKLTPKWVGKLPSPSNISFSYKISSATNSTIKGAEDLCLNNLMEISGMQSGIFICYDKNLDNSTYKRFDNGIFSENIDINSKTNTTIKSGEKQLHVKDIDSYIEQNRDGSYNVTKLYAASNDGFDPMFDDVEVTTSYGGHGLWRSAIIPGWGQFYKGSKAKGGIMLGGTVALAGVAVFAENKRSNHMRNLAESYGTDTKRYYADKADQMSTVRNICIGGAAALYVYNLIDAIVAPGAKRVKVTKRGNPKPSFSFIPTAGYNINGVAMACAF